MKFSGNKSVLYITDEDYNRYEFVPRLINDNYVQIGIFNSNDKTEKVSDKFQYIILTPEEASYVENQPFEMELDKIDSYYKTPVPIFFQKYLSKDLTTMLSFAIALDKLVVLNTGKKFGIQIIDQIKSIPR